MLLKVAHSDLSSTRMNSVLLPGNLHLLEGPERRLFRPEIACGQFLLEMSDRINFDPRRREQGDLLAHTVSDATEHGSSYIRI